MGNPQSSFLHSFVEAFQARAGFSAKWAGGQSLANTSTLKPSAEVRRPGKQRTGERFELADLAATLGSWRVVVEFESREVPLSNLLKYWPYIRGELDLRPPGPLLLCHFSDWWSYATRRDLWSWTLERMKEDPKRIVDIEGRQFDHWGPNTELRSRSVAQAIDWILETTGLRNSIGAEPQLPGLTRK